MPLRPVGVKLEMTARCNLRCAFCYTDSPRRTLERSPELTDADWRRIAWEAIELGVVETVVTGGEPLLRQSLTLELLDTFSAAGVRTMLNTNGWFLGDTVVRRLAAVDGLRVHVSLDGATPAAHDTARGLPGSWRRAVEGVDRLLAHGVTVQLVHVVTPDNEDDVPAMLDLARHLGVGSVRLAPVTLLGAAGREGAWSIDRNRMLQTVRTFRGRYPDDVRVLVAPGDGASDAETQRDGLAPMSVLVRPDGSVRLDSVTAVAFGSCASEPLSAIWKTISENWTRAAAQASGLTPYLDDDVMFDGGDDEPPRSAAPQTIELLRLGRAIDVTTPDYADLTVDRAADFASGLALARRYRPTRVRWDGVSVHNRIVRVVATGRTVQLNATAATVMDACAPGSPADAVRALTLRHPSTARATLVDDVLLATRRLLDLGILEVAQG